MFCEGRHVEKPASMSTDACFFHRFSCDFSLKIDVFSNVFSLLIACFFDCGDPCDSVVFIIRKLLFHISRFFFFPTKIAKNHWKNEGKYNAFFRIGTCFFNIATLYFTIRKLLFHFSCFCVFSKKKNRRKTCSKIETAFFSSKITKKSSRGSILGPKTGLRGRVFSDFWRESRGSDFGALFLMFF